MDVIYILEKCKRVDKLRQGVVLIEGKEQKGNSEKFQYIDFRNNGKKYFF